MSSKPSSAIWLGEEQTDLEAWRQLLRDALILTAGISLGASITIIAIAAAALG